MAISRMQQPRQMYGLGSLVKSVGKAVKGAVKGITGAVKDNPLLAAAALNFAPMLLPGGKPFIGMGGGQFNIPGGLTDIFTKKASEKTLGDTLKVFAGGSLLGGLLSQAEKEGDPEGITRNVGALKLKLADAYRNQRTFADAEDEEAAIAKQVELDTAEYNQDMNRGVLATGGRIGFFKGAQADARAGKGAMSPGTSMSGGFRGGGDGGGNSGPSGPPSIINAPQPTPQKKYF